ncbi:MAG: LD-carboxypeptidase [Candidatus Aminicenantes bacterium]|nr:LD-carboxypeptidase [Candidatus Aminicenantes bacterium]
MHKLPAVQKKVCFIAPSTSLSLSDQSVLERSARIIRESFGITDVFFSPYLFSSDRSIDHVTATAAERAEEFKSVIREYDLIVSVAGGTGAEDIILKIDRQDWRAIQKRRPLFLGFSDFTFLLSEIYARTGVPGILFPSLSLGRGHARRILALLAGRRVSFRGSFWLTPPPSGTLTGTPVGGNLTTFVNFMNREKPPRLNWPNHILFLEDLGIDIEDLHRLLAALRRHRVFSRVRGVVLGSLHQDIGTIEGKLFQVKALQFLMAFLNEIIKSRRAAGRPLPILIAEHFGHLLCPRQPAVPIGGTVTITPQAVLGFQLPGRRLGTIRPVTTANVADETPSPVPEPIPVPLLPKPILAPAAGPSGSGKDGT